RDRRGRYRFVDQPPLLFHTADPEVHDHLAALLGSYRGTLPDDRKALFDRYRVVDAAVKGVGIGSVGTRCDIVLLTSAAGDPLVLQLKQAMRSVLETHAGRSAYGNHGERVVMGQRLMQSSSDIFLGWVRSREGHDFYVRHMKDMKLSIAIES